MIERLVGSRVPDLRQVLVDLVLRYRMTRAAPDVAVRAAS
jgi:hypothetical protein